MQAMPTIYRLNGRLLTGPVQFHIVPVTAPDVHQRSVDSFGPVSRRSRLSRLVRAAWRRTEGGRRERLAAAWSEGELSQEAVVSPDALRGGWCRQSMQLQLRLGSVGEPEEVPVLIGPGAVAWRRRVRVAGA